MDCHCECFEDLLFEPEESLSTEDVLKLEEHLANCENCRIEREIFLESWLALGETETETEPMPAVRARVWEQIRAQEITPCAKPSLVLECLKSAYIQRLAVASIALFLGFHFGQSLRGSRTGEPSVTPLDSSIATSTSSATAADFIDPALIELASQEGYSVEIFPESTDFSPLDLETLSDVAPTAEERSWLKSRQGTVVPVQYISRDSGPP